MADVLCTATLEVENGLRNLVIVIDGKEHDFHLGWDTDEYADIWLQIAHLWIAAPGLLAACEGLCNAIERVGHDDKLEAISWDEDDAEEKTWRYYVPRNELEAYDSAKAAIAKAREEQ